MHRSTIAELCSTSLFYLWKNQYIISCEGWSTLNFHQQCLETSNFSTHLSLFSFFWISVNLMDLNWHLTGALICISLKNNNIEHNFMFFLVICLLFWEKCLFKLFAHILTGLFVFLLLSHNSFIFFFLHIAATRPSSEILFANTFSHFMGSPFNCLIMSFDVQNFLIYKVPFYILLFCALGATFKIPLPNSRTWRFVLFFL